MFNEIIYYCLYNLYNVDPNVDEDGRVCFPALHNKEWKSSTKLQDIIELFALVIDYPLTNSDCYYRKELVDGINITKYFNSRSIILN